MAIRLVRAYRTISGEAAITLAGMIPFDHLARGYAETYWGSREDGRHKSPQKIRSNGLSARHGIGGSENSNGPGSQGGWQELSQLGAVGGIGPRTTLE